MLPSSIYFVTISVLLVLSLPGIHGTQGSPNHIFQQVPIPLRGVLEENEIDFWSVYLPTEVDNSTCRSAVGEFNDDLDSGNITWAHKMMDSWGKQSDGYLIGIPFYFGVYDECKSTANTDKSIRGKYCKITIREYLQSETPPNMITLQLQPPWVPHEVQGYVPDVINQGINNNTLFAYSTCIPHACSTQDLEDSLMISYNNTDFIVEKVDCHFDLSQDDFSSGDIGYIFLLSLVAFLLLSSSLLDIYIQKTGRKALAKGGLKYLLPFSAYTNIEKLFHINTENAPGTISCLHGMRVLAMTWVVCAHQQSLTFTYSVNLYTMFDKMDGLLYQTLLNGFPSVDTFFFMSGFLMSYNVMKEFKRSGRFNIGLFYFHRLLRLIPPIALVVGLYATITIFFIEGPLAPSWYYWRKNCHDYWWWDVLLISNFVGRASHGSCVAQSWYLGVDTQIYLVAPLILLPILYKEKLGMVWLYIVTMVSIIVPSLITYLDDLPPTSLLLDLKGMDFMNYNYMMPWCRAGPIFVGIWLGIILQKQGRNKVHLEPWEVITGWTVAAMTGLMVVYGLWSYNVFPRKVDYDVMTAVLYGGLHRPAWAAALAWVTYACYNGYGGFVNDFLSHPIWQPISRLTYSIYLVAMPLQYAIVYNARVEYYFYHYVKILETVGALVISIIPSILVSITAESPIIGIEKLIFRSPGRGDNASKKPRANQGENNEAFEEMKEHPEMGITGDRRIQGETTVITPL